MRQSARWHPFRELPWQPDGFGASFTHTHTEATKHANMQPPEQTIQGLSGKTGARRRGGGTCAHLSIRMASVFRSFSSHVSFSSAMILSVSYKGRSGWLGHGGPAKQPLCPSFPAAVQNGTGCAAARGGET